MSQKDAASVILHRHRTPVAALLLGALALVAPSCGEPFRHVGKKLVVLGIDGMDPNLLREYMDAGLLPNFKALADAGTFVPLGTSNPPQSPVAWSNFITGMDPGGHGVYDFLHRDPQSYLPVSSTVISEGEPTVFELYSDWKLEIPPDSRAVRQGRAFWDLLGEAGVRCDVYRIPAAYPIQPSEQLTLSDMGTPDLQGGIDGMYAYYTSDVPDNFDRVKAGVWKQVKLQKGRATASLYGPPSQYKLPPPDKHEVPKGERPFTIFVDPTEDVVHIAIEEGDACVLEKGKWSEWLRCSFEYDTPLPGYSETMGGMVKFYLQQVRPNLRLYCSPVNIDPREPAMPISSPDDDAVVELAESIGPFYTQGLAEETKGLDEGTLDDGEFLSQCDDIHHERLRMLDHALARFDDGLLFFYFSTIDLRSHMMWRHIEAGHPARDEKLAAQYARSIEESYVLMDRALGHLREKIGLETPLMILSDHGFSPFTRRVNLNNWLLKEGYLVLTEEAAANPKGYYSLVEGGGVDRAKTRAYAVGFNSIYLNEKGREKGGIVEPAARDALQEEIRAKLQALTDDPSGRKVVRRVDLRDEVYHGDQLGHAPDLVIGYDRGYGASDTTALGQVQPKDPFVEDNKDLWSGNHLMAPEVVPGIFLTNRKIDPKEPVLYDLTVTMLEFFGVPKPPEMRGKSLY